MATYFSLRDGLLTDTATYGLGAGVVTNNTTSYLLSTSNSWSTQLGRGTIDSIAIQLSSRAATPVGVLSAEADIYSPLSGGSLTKFNITTDTNSPFGVGVDGSISFDGTTSYINVPAGGFVLGAGDFTVEMWINTIDNSLSNSSARTPLMAGTNAGTGSFRVSISSTTGAITIQSTGGTNILVGNTPINDGSWKHICVLRSGTSLKLFINGVLDATSTSSINFNNAASNSTSIGRATTTAGWYYGLISNIRLVTGAALEPTPVPTSPLSANMLSAAFLYKSPYANTYDKSQFTGIYNIGTYPISSFNTFDSSNVTDNTYYPWYNLKLSTPTIISRINLKTSNTNQLSFMALSTVNGINYNRILLQENPQTLNYVLSSNLAVSLSSASPFGEGTDESVILRGGVKTDNCITLSSATDFLDFSKSDFTFEGWFNFSVSANNYMINYHDPSYFTGFILQNDHVGKTIRCLIALDFGGWTGDINSSIIPVIDTWYHIALVRNRGTIRMYIDGVSSGTPYNIGANRLNTTSNTKIRFGSLTTTRKFNGLISNIRVTKYPRYTQNFTRPNAPFTDDDEYTMTLKSPYTLPSNRTVKNIDPITFTSEDDVYIGGMLSGSSVQTRTVSADYLQVVPASGTLPPISVKSISLHNRGTLFLPLSTSTTLTLVGSNGLLVASDGTLQIGTSSSPVLSNSTHEILLSGNEINVINGGNVNVYGSYKVPYTRLSTPSVAGASNFITTDSISSNWIVNDTLIFTPNTAQPTSYDQLRVSSFTADNRFITTPTAGFAHSVLSYVPNVANLTRNVKIGGISTALKGTIIASDSAKVNINNTEFKFINNSLLVGLNSGGNFTLSGCTLSAHGTENIVSPKPQGEVYSAIFNGTNSSIMGPANNTDFDVNAGTDFTLECFIKVSDTAFRPIFYVAVPAGRTGANDLSLRLIADSNRIRFYNTNGIEIFSPVNSLQINKWHHVAVVGRNSNVYIYVDGIQSSSSTTQTSWNFASTYVSYIGYYDNVSSADNYYKGKISNLRFVKGRAVYTGNFTPPTSPLVAISDTGVTTAILTLQDNPPIDRSYRNATLTLSNLTYEIDSPFKGNYVNFNNIKNIFYKTNYGIILDNVVSDKNTISDNLILSPTSGGIYINNGLQGDLTFNNNIVVGPSPYGSYIVDNSVSARINGTVSYNNTTGMILSGEYVGVLENMFNTYSVSAGVYVDGTIPHLNNITFSNITASNNKTLGFIVSANNNNYLTPIALNINQLVANDNLSGGFEAYNISGNLSGLELNRNGFYGMKTSIGNGPTIIDGITALMSNVATVSAGIGILSGYNYHPTVIKNANVGKLVGASTFGSGIILDSTKFSQFSVTNSTVSGGSSDFRLLTTRGVLEGSYLISNTNVGNLPIGAGINTSNYQSDVFKNTGFAFTNMNNASGYNVTYLVAGTRQIDSTVNIKVDTAPSERLTPQSARIKIRSGSKFVALNSGETTAVGVYVRKSTVASNGVAYNGSAPRLILKRNAAMGINADIVMDQLDTTSENFLKLSGVTPPATDDGVLEFYVDCDGTQGFINIDNWTAN
jgi:hypothetical protein